MRPFWQLLTRYRRSIERDRSRRFQIEFTPLEGRQLMTINAATINGLPITAVATPQVLRDTGGLVPVTITGTFHQGLTSFIAGSPKTEPPASSMFYIKQNLINRAALTPVHVEVTDQYRQYEPRVTAQVHLVESKFYFYTPTRQYVANEQLIRSYTYTATVYLQAKANPGTNGRRYTVSVSVSDSDNGAGVNFAVVVPSNARPRPGHKA